MLEKSDIASLATQIVRLIEDSELSKLSRELLSKNWIIARLNENIAAVYDTLKLGSVVDMRFLCLAQLAHELNRLQLPGAIAEVGVSKGNFSARIRTLFPGRTLYLFDTFEGFDQEQLEYELKNNLVGFSKRRLTSAYKEISVEIALKAIGDSELCIVKKGVFPDSARDVNEKFVFVSLDVDLYQPILAGLKFFYEHLVPGGYILVHDCIDTSKYRGAKVAVREFCCEYKIGYVPLPDTNSSVVITKAKN